MPSFAFTAAAATDQLTIVGHGLNSGDGPGAALVVAVAGAGGGLAPGTDVYAIRIDADHIKLATSSANALANVPINITADISGMLGMGLPWRRARTYVPASVSTAGAQVKSADLNALQDGLFQSQHGFMPLTFPGCAFAQGVNFTVSDGRRLDFSAAAVVYAPLLLPVGTRILNTEWSYLVGAAGSVATQVIRGKLDTTDALNNLAPVVGVDGDATNGGVTEANVISYNHTVAAGYLYFLRFECTNNASRLYGCTVWVDRPPT